MAVNELVEQYAIQCSGVGRAGRAIMERWLLDGTADAVNQAIQNELRRRTKLALSLLGDLAHVPRFPGYYLWMPMPRDDAERLYQAPDSFGVLLTSPKATETALDTPHSGLRLCLGATAISDLSTALATVARLAGDAPTEVSHSRAVIT